LVVVKLGNDDFWMVVVVKVIDAFWLVEMVIDDFWVVVKVIDVFWPVEMVIDGSWVVVVVVKAIGVFLMGEMVIGDF
jgi:hypothetical protein